MMREVTQGSSDIAEGIVQDHSPEHISPQSTNFLPWHKVRKQFIRQSQWNELARRNVKDAWRSDLHRPSEMPASGQSSMLVTKPLNCLVIPGDHLLDMRSLCTELADLDCYVRYLGFNESQGSKDVNTDVHVANNSLTSLPGVVSDSQVVKDRFEAIAGDNTIAFRTLKTYGPYHVVNLDLCGSMFPNSAKTATSYYNALHQLIKYQFQSQKANWLLFITTMVEPPLVDLIELEKLCIPTKANCAAHVDFHAKLKELLPTVVPGSASVLKLDGIPPEEMIRLFGVALGKWLINLGQAASPKWSVGMRRSFKYTVKADKEAVMLSLAFELSPNFSPPIDTAGVSNLPVSPKEFPSELECAIKLAGSVARIADVDSTLEQDQALKASLTEAAANLMEAAGFSREGFLAWVAAGELETS